MAGPGYSEGYLGALQQIAGVQEHQQQMQVNQLRIQKENQQLQESAQEKSVLAEVFQGRAKDLAHMSELDAGDALAKRYREAGQRLMQVSPKSALNILQEGDRLSHQNAQNRVYAAQGEKLKTDYLAGLATQVGDQESLTNFVRETARQGKVVDSRYQTWGPDTKAWLDRFAKSSVGYAKQQELDIRAKELEVKQANESRKEERDATTAQEATKRDELRKEGLAIRRGIADTKAASMFKLPQGSKAEEAERKVFLDTDTSKTFEQFPKGVQDSVMQEARGIATKLHSEQMQSVDPEDRLTPEELLLEARKLAIEKWTPKGEGLFGMSKGAERVAGGKAPTPPDAGIERALKLHGESYQPDVYEYKIQDGKVLKRKK